MLRDDVKEVVAMTKHMRQIESQQGDKGKPREKVGGGSAPYSG